MDKKIACIIAAVLAFFVGAILISEFPVIGTLVALLEVAAGFACGYFFKKFMGDNAVSSCYEKIYALQDEIDELKAAAVSKKTTVIKRQQKRVKEN